MNKKLLWPFLIGLLLLAACGGADESEEATGEPSTENGEANSDSSVEPVVEVEEEPDEPLAPTSAPTNTPVPTEEPEPTEAPAEEVNAPAEENETLNASDINFNLEGLESYTIAFEFSIIPEGSEEVSQSIAMNGVFQVEPPAQRMEMTFADAVREDDFSNGSIVLTMIDGVAYSKLPGFDDCISVPTDEMGDNPVEDLLTAETFLNGFEGLRRVRPNETINGVEVIHYVFDETTLTEQDVQLEEVSGDIYLAVDSGYVVRMIMEGKNPSGFDLSDDSSPEDRFIYAFDLTDINEPVEVLLPDGCQTAEEGGGFPKPANATQVSSFGGIETYQTEMSGADVAAFYQETLPADGWTRDEEESFALGDLFTEVYTNGTDQLQILIAPNGDIVSVTLVVEAIE